MTGKDALAILGYLCRSRNIEGKELELLGFIEYYLEKLDLPYEEVMDILQDKKYGPIYHLEFGRDSTPLPENYDLEELHTSDWDGIEYDENGRVGIYCETDGFIAWLDEYKKVWIYDERPETLERIKKNQKSIENHIRTAIKKWYNKPKTENKETVEINGIKMQKLELDGLNDYKKAINKAVKKKRKSVLK